MPQVSWGEGFKAFSVVRYEQRNDLNTECVYGADYKSSANEEGLFDTFEVLGVNGPHLSECTPNTEG
ncbi:hypothetical protein [Plebeiibacterium sediminum]|uniref:Uncharacterized protein n=1 Tax=Plebeiibacterium sediminum TaxID=2992112 RepID=A0AAE3SHJ1_9BACT|nr:hypothetical protein [Plebeiobacterium sediminum]MCW3789570.1 hypothetical protein [Plebeiobacterium sediminum]